MKVRPNIIVFMTDQQHAETIYNRDWNLSPNVQRLMDEGVAFTRAFTPCPMCTPARASALTGQYPHEHGLVQNTHSPVNPKESLDRNTLTIGEALRGAGYETVYAGKWHVGKTGPQHHGFDRVLYEEALHAEAASDFVFHRSKDKDHVLAGSSDERPEETNVFQLAQRITSWLKEPKDRPFFLFASCTEPHPPWIVPEPYASMFPPESIQEWDNYRSDFSDKPLTYSKHYNQVNFCRLRNNWPEAARALGKYFGLIRMIDDAFGSIMKELENTGLLDNTIVIFTSDHGEMMGRHGLIGKNELASEDLIRIPLVLYFKNKWEPGARDGMVVLSDLFNTIMELTGNETADLSQSRSFAAQIAHPECRIRDHVVIQHHGATIHMNTVRAIRTERYKYVFRSHEIDEFYDLLTDPHEIRNLISSPEQRTIIEEMKEALLDWAEKNDDTAIRALRNAISNPEPVEYSGNGNV